MEEMAPYLYLMLAFLGGCGAILLYFYQKGGLGAVGSDARIAALLSSSNSSFYYRSLSTDREWFSRKLRELFELPASAKYAKLLAQLPEESLGELDEKVEALLANEIPNFTVEIEDPVKKRFLECYGVIVEAESDKHLVLWWKDVTVRAQEVQRLRHENERSKLEMRQLSNMFNALPMPVWQRNEELRIRYCNLAFLEAAEETTDSSGGESLEIYNQGAKLASQALKVGERQDERRHVVLDGERKLFDFMEFPWEDRKNLTGIAIDKTDIEELNAKLQDMLATQSNLLETITSAIAIFGSDQCLKFYNNAFVRMWKLDASWLSQNPKYGDVLEKLRENRMLPEQANFPAFKQKRIKMFTGLLDPNEEFYYLPDGRTVRQLAIPDASGGILFADEDVTDRLALERSYNTLIAVQRETLDHLTEGVAVFGQDGRLKLHNPVYREMWNLSEKLAEAEPHINDLLDKQRSLYYFEDWKKFKSHFTEMLSVRKTSKLQIERRDGKVFEVIALPLPDGQTLLNYVDLTDSMLVERSLREKNEALEEADRLKSEFLANVSYELRSPLTSIRGFYEMLNQAYVGSLTDKQAEYVESIGTASQHLMNLIDDILDIASIEAGYLQLDVSKVDVLSMLTAVQTMLRDKAEAGGLKMSFDCPIDVGKIDGDQSRLKQALFNLVGNAIKYTDEGGEVNVSAQVKAKGAEGFIHISVQDTGMGIAENEHEAVFDKFYRSGAASRKSSGTGLGLAMVKSFIELHGGYLTLESEEGKGTTITCILPRKQPEDDIVIPLPTTENKNALKH